MNSRLVLDIHEACPQQTEAFSGQHTCIPDSKAGKLSGGAVCIHACPDQQQQDSRLLDLGVELGTVPANVADEVAGLGSQPRIRVVQERFGQAADVGGGKGLVVGGATPGGITHQHEAACQLSRAVVQVQNAADSAQVHRKVLCAMLLLKTGSHQHLQYFAKHTYHELVFSQ